MALSTARPNVGSLVPFVSRRGAVATQGRVNSDLGRQGLVLLDQGVPIHVALLVASEQPQMDNNLRVDDHADPVAS